MPGGLKLPPGRPLFPQLSNAVAQIGVQGSGATRPDAGTQSSSNSRLSPWFLGLDIGTIGLSAVLLNGQTHQMVPIVWRRPSDDQHWLRWPIDFAIDRAQRQHSEPTAAPSAEAAILWQLKPALALPLRRGLAGTREHFPLLEPVHRPLTSILESLKPDSSGRKEDGQSWFCSGLGMDQQKFNEAMDTLSGIGVSYPAKWPNQYQTNIQNAILGSGLVSQPSDVHFIQETAAAALACLQPDTGPVSLSISLSVEAPLHAIAPEGYACVVSAGASTTELAIVDLASLSQGNRLPLASRTLAYAGRALDQDILFYLLYPQLQASPLAEVEHLLNTLQLDDLDWPQVGQPEITERRRLHLRLCSSAPGRQLLAIAQCLKHELQTQSRSTYTLAQHRGQVTRDELGHQILLPYLQLLRHQIQALIDQSELSPQSIQHVICSGGTATMRIVALWLRQYFTEATLLSSPSATIGSPDESVIEASVWLGSQVAYGLASLPLHPALGPSLAVSPSQ